MTHVEPLAGETPLVVRVLPDVAAIDKEFDYLVPESWHTDGRAARLTIGSMVRIGLHGRRVRGWVTDVGVVPPAGVELRPLAKLSGVGPTPDLIDLAEWAAWRWAGRRVPFFRVASPPRMIAGVSSPHRRTPAAATGPPNPFDGAFDLGVGVVRLPPRADDVAVATAAVRRGDALIIAPELATARRLATSLRRSGTRVAFGPDDWAMAAGGGASVVGTRSAAWMPMPSMASVVVFDEHDEVLQEERAPTWNARDVAVERARRAGVPAVLVSPVPSLEALRIGRVLKPSRADERAGWPAIDVIDRRLDDPTRKGPFAESLARRLPAAGRIVCVLNRKGRARMVACAACGELARASDDRSPMIINHEVLETVDGAERRPVVCAACGSTVLRNLRIGVTRAREELAALLGEPVGEVTKHTDSLPDDRVLIGTEAVIRRVDRAAVVVFLDFDQELLSSRQRATEQALALLARAAKVVDGRNDGGRIIVQTRLPDHLVLRAAVNADPALVAVAERDRRRAAGVAPYGAQALVSGPGAAELVEAVSAHEGVEQRGPSDDRFLLRASEHAPLLQALAHAPRPGGRVRVEVDPLRA